MIKKKENLNIICILISTIIVTILSNFNLFGYDKYFLFPIFILLITYLFLTYKNNIIVNKKGYVFLIPICIIILGTFFFKTNISNVILNIIVLPVLISILFLELTNNNYSISGNFIKWFCYLFPYKLFSNLKNIKMDNTIESQDKRTIKNIIIGFLISIPFVGIILFLLTSADMYFSVFIDKIIKHFGMLFNINYIINNILVFVIYFIISYSVFINIKNNKNKIVLDGKKRRLELSIVNTILIIVNLVYVLFIVSEISKLSCNFLELPSKYTYATYAREGFFQLLLVTIINFSLIFYFIYKTDLINRKSILKYLILILISFTILLIFNSYYRMFLYMYEYGFTILRTQVILFLLMELIIAILLIKKIVLRLKHKDAYIIYWVVVVTYTINILVCNTNTINLINDLLGYK